MYCWCLTTPLTVYTKDYDSFQCCFLRRNCLVVPEEFLSPQELIVAHPVSSHDTTRAHEMVGCLISDIPLSTFFRVPLINSITQASTTEEA